MQGYVKCMGEKLWGNLISPGFLLPFKLCSVRCGAFLCVCWANASFSKHTYKIQKHKASVKIPLSSIHWRRHMISNKQSSSVAKSCDNQQKGQFKEGASPCFCRSKTYFKLFFVCDQISINPIMPKIYLLVRWQGQSQMSSLLQFSIKSAL